MLSGGLGRAAAEPLAGTAQALLCRIGHQPVLRLANQVHHDLRIEEADDDTARHLLPDDCVAEQQQADVRHGRHGLVRQRWVARAEDAVGLHLLVQLLDRRRSGLTGVMVICLEATHI
jgi:hypothetical protein